MLTVTACQWTKTLAAQGNAQAGPSRESKADPGPIDLTLLDSDEEDEYDDISLAAAPCPHCHQTFAFENDQYERHVTECSQERSPSKISTGGLAVVLDQRMF